MRYGALAQNPVEEIMLGAPNAPTALFDTFLPLLQARAIMAGVSLGVFEGLRAGARTATDLGAALGLDADTLDLMLRVLACAGYVAPAGSAYGPTDVARNTLLSDGSGRVTAYVGLNAMAWDFAPNQILVTGRAR